MGTDISCGCLPFDSKRSRQTYGSYDSDSSSNSSSYCEDEELIKPLKKKKNQRKSKKKKNKYIPQDRDESIIDSDNDENDHLITKYPSSDEYTNLKMDTGKQLQKSMETENEKRELLVYGITRKYLMSKAVSDITLNYYGRYWLILMHEYHKMNPMIQRVTIFNDSNVYNIQFVPNWTPWDCEGHQSENWDVIDNKNNKMECWTHYSEMDCFGEEQLITVNKMSKVVTICDISDEFGMKRFKGNLSELKVNYNCKTLEIAIKKKHVSERDKRRRQNGNPLFKTFKIPMQIIAAETNDVIVIKEYNPELYRELS